jgi:hypothetical protein
MKYGKRRIVEECEVITERSPGSRLAAVYAAQGTNPLFGYTRCNGGKRRWLLCPACHKRAGKLHRPLMKFSLLVVNVTN